MTHIQMLQRLRDVTGNHDLTCAAAEILLWLAESGPLYMSNLETLTRLSQAAVSRNVAKLARAGLLVSYEDPADRRYKYVVMTTKGRGALC
jgi:DNA-binding MarR family transcriptional regulator